MSDPRLQSWFYPTPTSDPGHNRNARTLQFACLLLASAVSMVAILNVIGRELGREIPLLIFAVAGLVAGMIMNHAGRWKWAALIACSAVLLTAILLVFEAHDGFRSLAMLLFPGMLLISVMLLDRTSYTITAGVVLVAVTALGIAERRGLTRAIPRVRSSTTYESILIVDLNLLVFALIGSRIARDAQANVFDLRSSIEQLSTANLELSETAKALRESEQQQASIYNAVRDIIFHLAVEPEGRFRFVSVNAAFLRVTGLSRDMVVGKTVNEVIPEPSLPMVLGRYRQAIEEKQPVLWEETSDYPTGRLTGEVSVVPVFDDKGACTHLVGSVHNITERKRAEAELRDGKERLALAQTAAQLGVWDRDLRTNVITLCGRYAQLLGLSPDRTMITREELLGLIHPEDRERFETLRREARERTHIFDADFRVIWPEGSTRWLHAKGTVLVGDCGLPSRSMGVIWDITERKEAEAKLRESEERFRRVFEEGPLGLALVSRDYTFFRVNSALCQMVGYPEAELVRKTFVDITHPDDLEADVQLAERLFMREIPSYRIQKRYIRKNGEIIWINLTASVVRDSQGVPTYGIAMIEDITEMKRTQDEALFRQKLESVGTLAGGIAHDFNNLLGAVQAHAELAMTELDAGASSKDSLQAIREVTTRGSEIVRQLMIYAGTETAADEGADLSKTVEDMLSLLRVSVTKHAVIQADLDPRLPAIRASAAQIRQIAMNLITNASDAIGDRDGVIRISTRRFALKEQSAARFSGDLLGGDYVQLEVSDTGHGMSPQTQAMIFDPFFTTKSAGRGLGLAVVQGIVRSLDGAIRVASEPGKGANFRILLPCDESIVSAADRAVSGPVESAAQAQHGAILVVEDEHHLRHAVAKLLSKSGFQVFEAGDGSSAIDLLRARGREIDTILLDMTIPGASTQEIVAEAADSRPDIKVVLTSAYSREMLTGTFNSPQIRGFIRKPFRFGDLLQTLRSSLSM